MNGWVRTIIPTLSVISVLMILIVSYFGRINDTTRLAEATARAQADVIELVKTLGERVKADDAAVQQDAKRCRQGFITDREVCGAAGVTLPR